MIRTFRSVPSAALLAAQLAAVVIYPFTSDTHAGRALLSLLGVLILALVVRTVRATPALTWVTITLGIPAVVLLVLQAVSGSDDLLPWSSALEAGLYFYAAAALIRYILADHEISRDEMFAVGATFTLVAWAFAYVYIVCQAIEPGSFTGAVDPGSQRSWNELLYLSFTTLTSTGLSDIGPIKDGARSLVMLEQLAGLGYVVLLVSRVVALTVLGRQAEQSSAPKDD